jgi:diguanylate cyclase (GGDEF)-like protein/PAS domain S-box-containing protein
MMLMASPDGIVVTNQSDEVVLYTGEAERLFGYEPVEMYGRSPGLLFSNAEEYRRFQEQLGANKAVSNHNLTATTADGDEFPVQVSASVLLDRIGQEIARVLYVRDHTDVQEIEDTLRTKNAELNTLVEKLEHVAKHDHLTGLLNRSSAIQSAEEILLKTEGRSPMSVAVMDLDHFKRINDSYGHLVGDEVLAKLASVLQGATRGPDIVGRFGGEEFVAFLPKADLEAGAVFAERIRRSIQQASVRIDSEIQISVTISVGVACIPDCAGTIQEAIRIADNRLLLAKRTRNCVVSNDDLEQDDFKKREAA